MIRDATAIAGLALVSVGCWLVSAPLCFIVTGGLLLAVALYGALKNAARKNLRNRRA